MIATDRQIATLRDAARRDGDVVLTVICDVALGDVDGSDPDCLDGDGYPDYSGGGHSPAEEQAIRSWLRATQDDARRECARYVGGAR